MIDLHSHILPGMDDGSRDVLESLAMLEASAAQGVGLVAATPHFYAEENSPERFLSRRAEAAQRLRAALRPGLPEIRLGAEVHYFEGIARSEWADALCLEGTGLLLLEMPFAPWTERMLQEVRELQNRPGLTVVLAHIERYCRWQDKKTWVELLNWGVLNQCNAACYLHWRTRRAALELLRAGRVHFLGSDCHNMDARPPRLGEAMLRLKAGDRDILLKCWQRFLPDWKEVAR